MRDLKKNIAPIDDNSPMGAIYPSPVKFWGRSRQDSSSSHMKNYSGAHPVDAYPAPSNPMGIAAAGLFSHRRLEPHFSPYLPSLTTAQLNHLPQYADMYSDEDFHLLPGNTLFEKLNAYAQAHSDFTGNAIYLICQNDGFYLFDAVNRKFITPEEFSHIEDIQKNTLKLTNGNPSTIIEKPILILRALKMMWDKKFTLDPDLHNEIKREWVTILRNLICQLGHPEFEHIQVYVRDKLEPLWHSMDDEQRASEQKLLAELGLSEVILALFSGPMSVVAVPIEEAQYAVRCQ